MHINMTADGNSDELQTASPGNASGLVEFFVQPTGDFGGGTLSLEVDVGSGFVAEYSWTEIGARIFELPTAVDYRFSLTDSTDADLDIEVR